MRYNYGQEYIWKNDAAGIKPELEDYGRTDYAGTQTQASVYAGHCSQGYGDKEHRLKMEHGNPTVSMGIYARVLFALNLENDITLLAADDALGRRAHNYRRIPEPL